MECANIAQPSEGSFFVKSFLQLPIRALGATSPCMGEFRQRMERCCRENPGAAKTLDSLSKMQVFHGIMPSGCEVWCFAEQTASVSRTARCPTRSDLILNQYPPQKRISHRAPSDADDQICFYIGRSAVGKFLERGWVWEAAHAASAQKSRR